MKACCITGPRAIPMEKIHYVRQALRREIEQAIADGFTGFLSDMDKGTNSEFTMLAAEKKQEIPGLFLEAVYPHAGRMKVKNKQVKHLMSQCNGFKLISQEYSRDCQFAANRYLLEFSERVIAVSDGNPKSNTAQMIRMATAKELDVRVIELAENTI
ncbi:putative phage-like protein YoqJ [Desulfitobacterium sp. LBE]|uniref:SLOG family protein n=1 Tax=Desulfitobacterium sp. LBE TaxID=884086 RepID=UPI00119AD8BF|nr:SLOG family protein [Desulfitobacterium sp. LBE]TWH60291.1 putative phage-like protein YoqJ [Desulfitobacterium sp. LBE]